MVTGTSRRLTFNGAANLTLAPAAMAWSDPGGGNGPPTLQRLDRDVLERAGATLFTLAGPDIAKLTRAMEAVRQEVNTWIRTQAAFDSVIDFDRLMSVGRSYDGIPSLKPEFACDDNVHPNSAGYRAMGEFVDLAFFTATGVRPSPR